MKSKLYNKIFLFEMIISIIFISACAGVGYTKISGFFFVGYCFSSAIGGFLTLIMYYLLKNKKEVIKE